MYGTYDSRVILAVSAFNAQFSQWTVHHTFDIISRRCVPKYTRHFIVRSCANTNKTRQLSQKDK